MKNGMLKLEKPVAFIIAIQFSLIFAATVFADITHPRQPSRGPGGSEYAYEDVTIETRGSSVKQYDIWEPSPRTSTPLPVIAFLHGFQFGPEYNAFVLNGYEDFIEHLVKKGYIVIYPYFQDTYTPPKRYDTNAADAIKDALNHISANPGSHAQPRFKDGRMQFGLIGHSYGGITAGNLTATWRKHGIPRPLALMSTSATSGIVRFLGIYRWEISPIDADTNMLVIVASQDMDAKDEGAESIWNHTQQIDDTRKDWIVVNSDYHGWPNAQEDLEAEHLSACSIEATAGRRESVLDTLDWYGYWKWSVALMNFTFFGTDGDYAFGGTYKQTDMGSWSDGQPVNPAEVYDYPVWPGSTGESPYAPFGINARELINPRK